MDQLNKNGSVQFNIEKPNDLCLHLHILPSKYSTAILIQIDEK